MGIFLCFYPAFFEITVVQCMCCLTWLSSRSQTFVAVAEVVDKEVDFVPERRHILHGVENVLRNMILLNRLQVGK